MRDQLSARPFYVGDVVTLRSGGPHMTVINVADDCKLTVAWTDSSELLQIEKRMPPEAFILRQGLGDKEKR